MSKVECTFWLDGKEYAVRLWEHVPGTGDHVVLGKRETCYLVKSVCWHTKNDFQAVQIEIELWDA